MNCFYKFSLRPVFDRIPFFRSTDPLGLPQDLKQEVLSIPLLRNSDPSNCFEVIFDSNIIVNLSSKSRFPGSTGTDNSHDPCLHVACESPNQVLGVFIQPNNICVVSVWISLHHNSVWPWLVKPFSWSNDAGILKSFQSFHCFARPFKNCLCLLANRVDITATAQEAKKLFKEVSTNIGTGGGCNFEDVVVNHIFSIKSNLSNFLRE
ncbi:hypothetical protein Ancab_039617 [Ancistrocladus abbreviatus]